jgi:ribosomal protein S18 acetylase RimI-like enzyme
MEILAALDAARTLDGPLEVVSDSTYVVNCFRARWWEKWLANGWRNAARQPVANGDLWRPLVQLYCDAPGRLVFRWVKGHSTDPFNDLVDRLAVTAANAQRGGEGDQPPGPESLGLADARAPAGRPVASGGRSGGAPAGGAGPRASQPSPRASRPSPGHLPFPRFGAAGGTRLRSGGDADAEAVLCLWRVAGAPPSPTDDVAGVRRLIGRDPEALIVAEAGDELVGTVIAGFDGWRAHFHRLAVHPDWRRRGVARALVEEAERRLLARGARRAGAIVVTADAGAVAFWEAAGYSAKSDARRYTKEFTDL